jgi:hypothetical protein
VRGSDPPEQAQSEELDVESIFDFDIQPSDIEPTARLDQERSAFDNAEREENLAGIQQDREERKKYAKHYYNLVRCWVWAILALVLLQGVLAACRLEFLSDAVLMTLLGTTTATIISIVLIVVTYLFPKRRG